MTIGKEPSRGGSGVQYDALIEAQRDAARRVTLKRIQVGDVHLLGAVDAHHSSGKSRASAVLSDLGSNKIISRHSIVEDERFPYIAGFLYKREAEIMVRAVRGLESVPDLLLVDGHGIAHPRGAGLAVFVGLELMIPTIGIAKSLLAGTVVEGEGLSSPILMKGEVVGFMVSSHGSRRYYMSPGNLATAEDLVALLSLWNDAYPELLSEADRESRRIM